MGGGRRAPIMICALFCTLLLDPLVFRATRIKVITGEVRLKNGTATVELRQSDKFKDANSYWVGVTAIDSSTAQTPDSVRTFVIKQLAANQFMIRSLKYSSDTIKVRYIAEGR